MTHMMAVALTDLSPWPTARSSQAATDRHRLLVAVAVSRGIVSPRPSAHEWATASISVKHLPAFRAAVDEEGARTDRRQILVDGGSRWQSIRRHPGDAHRQLLALIDRHVKAAT